MLGVNDYLPIHGEDLAPDAYAANIAYLAHFMDEVGLGERWVFRPPGRQDVALGALDYRGLEDLYRRADAVFNVCGAQEIRPIHRETKCLVYIQTDPGPEQVAIAQRDPDKTLEQSMYDYRFTYGANIGKPDCSIPVRRFSWMPTVPPVCTDWWASADAPSEGAVLSTIAKWHHEGKDVVWEGETWHWSKDHEFRKFLSVAAESSLPMSLALSAIEDDERTMLDSMGWDTIPTRPLADPAVYRDFIWSSLGEFTAAKEQYVWPWSGWLSDRSVCYLAAGRPVIMQDTGFTDYLPTGKGLLAFTTVEEALAAIDLLASDVAGHAAAAREIADE